MRVLFNISNHPSDKWGEKQIQAAKELADVIKDLHFPNVPPKAPAEYVTITAMDIAKSIENEKQTKGVSEVMVHVMGEMTLTYGLVVALRGKGIRCFASCTERIVTELPDGTKQSKFDFVQFREYGVSDPDF